MFVGLNGIAVKSHGGTSEQGFLSALEVAEVEARRNVPALISDALAPAATAGRCFRARVSMSSFMSTPITRPSGPATCAAM